MNGSQNLTGHEQPNTPPPGGDSGARSGIQGPLRILVAEDNPINRRLMGSLLGRQGHEVVMAENGRLALDAVMKQPFDLIVMDIQMPEMDGIEATMSIRALDNAIAKTPILAVSADAKPERRAVYFDAGVSDFLPKPIMWNQLIDAIARNVRPARAAA